MYWTLRDVMDVTKLSESSIRRMIRKNAFPAGYKLIGRRKVWKPTEVKDWMDQILTESGPKRPEKSGKILSKFF